MALLRRMTCNLRHPVGLDHPVLNVNCGSFSAKEPLSIELFWEKWPVKIRHAMDLCLVPSPPCMESVWLEITICAMKGLVPLCCTSYAYSWHAYINTWTNTRYIYTYIQTYIHTLIYMYIYVHAYMYTYTCIYIYMYKCIHACIHTYINVYTLIHTYISMHTCFRVCMHSYVDTHIRIDM